MLAFPSIRFFIVALAGGAVAQDLLGVHGAVTGQLNTPSVDGINTNSPVDTGVVANPEPWIPGTEDANIPVPNPEEANIIDTIPPPAPDSETAPAAVDVAVPAPLDLPLDTNTSSPDPPPTSSPSITFEPFTTLPTETTTTTPNPPQTPPPGIILRPTNLPSPDTKSTATTAAIGITMAPPRPTTLQTITTTTRPEIPLWTPGSFTGDGVIAEGEGEGAEKGGKQEAPAPAPKEDFKPAHSWVLPLNWAFPVGGKGDRKGQIGVNAS